MANDYKQRMMDPISDTFCASKWYDGVFFLNEGQTKSCHHTPAHKISEVEVKLNPSALHNTADKRRQRTQMLAGERPVECNYCWNVEDAVGAKDTTMGVHADRVAYTRRYSDDDIKKTVENGPEWNAHLRTMEVSFDRTCNFACSYCSPRFSTTWGKDIKTNGSYILQLPSHYQHDGASQAEPYGRNNEKNPYLAAFWEWWPELSQTLEQFRITGGEPIMSANFWKLVDRIKKDGVHDNMLISVNSNLGAKKSLISDLIDFTYVVPRFSLFTSCEAHGAAAEYIRDGLDYEYWLSNLRRVLEQGKVECVTIMTTITAMSMFSFTKFLDDILELREDGGYNLLVSFNLLTAPSFTSVLILPEELREGRAQELADWTAENFHRLSDWEQNGARKVVAYLREGQDPSWTNDAQLRMKNELDFYLFYLQYDERRGKSFRKTFPPELVEWYNDLAEQYEEDVNTHRKLRSKQCILTTGPSKNG
jgi:organic radical activating enzyme